MAIYRTGTASMTAAGVVTGVGTKWKDALSLIRVGATIVFLNQPLQLATISAIVSDTELRVVTSDAGVAPAGSNYVILLHDSITVDGLAQDVAETLRYYQGKETEIAEAIEFFENFDLDEFKALVAQVELAAQQAEASKNAAAQSAQGASQSAANSASSATTAGQAKDQAIASAAAAGTAYSNANSARIASESARDLSKQYADSINPALLLQKSQNLNDVANKAQALKNLQDSKPLPLSGDGVGDYDATTLRQVRNLVGAGTVGPTMNGVMNFGVGMSRIQDSRAYIAPYEVFQDGQLLDRALWPELWAYAQLNGAISDSDWVTYPANRGAYSTGNGTTTFRVPDKNGVQRQGVNGFTGPNSIPALYASGDGGESSQNGKVLESGLPNVKGHFDIRFGRLSNGNGAGMLFGGDGMISATTIIAGAQEPMQFAAQTSTSFQRIATNAGSTNAIYARDLDRVRPNTVVGVWVVRASGGFTAANTSWSVINADSVAPPAGNTAIGGIVESNYKVAGVTRALAQMRSDWSVGNAAESATGITFRNVFIDTAGVSTEYVYSLNGASGAIVTAPNSGWTTATGKDAPLNANTITLNGLYAGVGAGGTNWGNEYAPLLHMSRYAGSSQGQFQIDPLGVTRVRGGNGTTWSAWAVLQAQGTSGREFKKDIKAADPDQALDRVMGLEMVTFVYKDDEKERERFGIIAEDAELVAPLYIKHDEETVEVDGEVITRDHPRIDTTPMVLDLLGCVQALKAEIDALKAEIAALKKE